MSSEYFHDLLTVSGCHASAACAPSWRTTWSCFAPRAISLPTFIVPPWLTLWFRFRWSLFLSYPRPSGSRFVIELLPPFFRRPDPHPLKTVVLLDQRVQSGDDSHVLERFLGSRIAHAASPWPPSVLLLPVYHIERRGGWTSSRPILVTDESAF